MERRHGLIRSDNELMADFLRGDREAYGELVLRHKDPLVRFLTRFTGNPDLAADMAQDAFLRAFQKAHLYQSRWAFSTWLYRIAINLTKNALKRRQRWRWISIEPGGEDERPVVELSAPGHHAPDRHVEAQEAKAIVDAAFREVPPRFRVPLLLKELQDRSYEEIGEILSIPVGTVKSRINRGRTALRKALLRMEGTSRGGSWRLSADESRPAGGMED